MGGYPHDAPHDAPHDQHDDENKLLSFCDIPRTRQEIMDYMGLADRKSFREHYIKPLLQSGKLVMTIPDKPKSKNQKYIRNQEL